MLDGLSADDPSPGSSAERRLDDPRGALPTSSAGSVDWRLDDSPEPFGGRPADEPLLPASAGASRSARLQAITTSSAVTRALSAAATAISEMVRTEKLHSGPSYQSEEEHDDGECSWRPSYDEVVQPLHVRQHTSFTTTSPMFRPQ